MPQCARLVCVSAVLLVAVPSAQAEWSAVAQTRTTYTDNVFQFSASRRQTLGEDPSQPTVATTQKQSDVVWDPSAELIRSFSNPVGSAHLSLKAHGFLYTANPKFNHGDYRLQFKQALSQGTAVLVRYRYVPSLLLGPNFERRSGTNRIEDERVTSHIFRMELERRLGARWAVAMVTRGGLRLFNEPFTERDTRFWTIGPHVIYAVTERVAASIGYLFERGYADGAGDARYNDDVSYRQHVVMTTLDTRLTDRLSLFVSYLYRHKDFTSDLIGDTHHGRHDHVHQGIAEVRYAIFPAVTVTGGLQRTQRASTNESRGYQESQVWIGGQYRF